MRGLLPMRRRLNLVRFAPRSMPPLPSTAPQGRHRLVTTDSTEAGADEPDAGGSMAGAGRGRGCSAGGLPPGQTRPSNARPIADYQKVLIERLLDAKPGDVIEIPAGTLSPSTAASTCAWTA